MSQNNNLFGYVDCTKGWRDRCAVAENPKCRCKCGGANHGTKVHDSKPVRIKNKPVEIRDKRNMFYLLKKDKVADIKVGERVMVLADFSGVEAGMKGVISEVYTLGKESKNPHHGVMVEWDWEAPQFPRLPKPPTADGFGEDELEYLAFATERHPTKGVLRT